MEVNIQDLECDQPIRNYSRNDYCFLIIFPLSRERERVRERVCGVASNYFGRG